MEFGSDQMLCKKCKNFWRARKAKGSNLLLIDSHYATRRMTAINVTTTTGRISGGRYYNHDRPHEALELAVPASRYQPSPLAKGGRGDFPRKRDSGEENNFLACKP